MRYFALFAGFTALTVATPILERKEAAAAEADAIVGAGKVTFQSKEVRQAYIDRDGAALSNYSSIAQQDYERLTRTMYDSKLSPFNQVTLGGRVVHFYGDNSTYIWATVLQAEGPEPEELDFDAASNSDPNTTVVHKATIEIGHYSTAGGQASSFLVEVPRWTTDAALGLAVFSLVQESVGRILEGRAPAVKRLLDAKKDARALMKGIRNGNIDPVANMGMLEDAAEELGNARRAVVAESATTSKSTQFLAKNKRVVGGVAGLVASVAATLLFDKYVLPYVIQDYVVKVNVVNLDQRAWTVEKWYESNAIVVGGESFKAVNLDPPSGRTVPFHPELEADFKEATDVTYTFQNSFNWFAGLGVALQVTSTQDPTTGFMIGYDCPYAKDNSLAIQAGIPKSPKDWYDDSANWPRPKPLSVNDTLTVGGDQVELSAVTDALSGHDNHFYHVWVTIGSVKASEKDDVVKGM